MINTGLFTKESRNTHTAVYGHKTGRLSYPGAQNDGLKMNQINKLLNTIDNNFNMFLL